MPLTDHHRTAIRTTVSGVPPSHFSFWKFIVFSLFSHRQHQPAVHGRSTPPFAGDRCRHPRLTHPAIRGRSTPPSAAYPARRLQGINAAVHGQRKPASHREPAHRRSCAPGLAGGIWGYELEPSSRAHSSTAPSSAGPSKVLCRVCTPKRPRLQSAPKRPRLTSAPPPSAP